ncbi:MAG: vacuolar family H+-ATPase subunit H [Lachnospiraceae bacterium]|nr:vacuolar family H+-ATPase subunit H [Lachnospiraceae bacterium]
MKSRIEQLIEEIETYIDSCKPQALSGGRKIIVDRDEMEELLVELRMRTPDEIKKYQKIISNQEAILADAKKQAESMVNAAREEAEEMLAEARSQKEELLNQHEIMQRAYEQAESMVNEAQEQAQKTLDSAVEDADNIRMGAIAYTDEMLNSLQTIISHTIENTEKTFNSFVSSMQSSYGVVTSNRNELSGSIVSEIDTDFEDYEDDDDEEDDED